MKDTEGQPRRPGQRIGPDGAEQQAEHGHQHRLQPGAIGEVGDECKPGEHHHRVLGGPEGQHPARQRGRQIGDGDHANRASEERAQGGDAQRRAGAPFAGHLIAVETGDHRRSFARDAHQHRRDGATIGDAVVDARQHDDRRGDVHLVRDGQQQCDGGERAQAGQDADDRAQQHADETAGEGGRLEDRGEAADEVFHYSIPAARISPSTARSSEPSGRLTWSNQPKPS